MSTAATATQPTTDYLASIVATWSATSAAAAGYTQGAPVQVGDVVLAAVRGYLRTAVVTKVGRTNVTVVCTTDGAIKEAARIREHAAYRLTAAGRADTERSIRAMTLKNRVFYAEQVAKGLDRYTNQDALDTYAAKLAVPLDADVAEQVAYCERSSERALHCEPCVTTKTVKASTVWARA